MSNNKRQEDFENLTLANNFLFGEVMCDEKTGKDVLEIILGVDIEKVVVVDKKVYVAIHVGAITLLIAHVSI